MLPGCRPRLFREYRRSRTENRLLRHHRDDPGTAYGPGNQTRQRKGERDHPAVAPARRNSLTHRGTLPIPVLREPAPASAVRRFPRQPKQPSIGERVLADCSLFRSGSGEPWRHASAPSGSGH